MPKNKIALALDVPNKYQAEKLLDQVSPYIGVVKIGLELFTALGPDIFSITTLPIFLDLKLHDIPATVQRTVQVAIDHGVKYLSLHCQQQSKTLELASKQVENSQTTLLGITVLTSLNQNDLSRLWISEDIKTYTQHLVRYGMECGINGFVCSSLEVKELREKVCQEAVLVVPGIRSIESQEHDQRRIGSPKRAIENGANLIVVGRMIRDAENPVKAIQEILEEIK